MPIQDAGEGITWVRGAKGPSAEFAAGRVLTFSEDPSSFCSAHLKEPEWGTSLKGSWPRPGYACARVQLAWGLHVLTAPAGRWGARLGGCGEPASGAVSTSGGAGARVGEPSCGRDR